MTIDFTDEVVVVAATAWGEARSIGIPGMWGVCNVIANRVRYPRWWGSTFISVCLFNYQGVYQFDCWRPDTANGNAVRSVTISDADFVTALGLAYMAVNNNLPDTTQNADSYYDDSIPAPSWAVPVPAGGVHTTDIGTSGANLLHFWRLELPPPN